MGADFMIAHIEIGSSEQMFINSMYDFIKSCPDESIFKIYDDLFCDGEYDEDEPVETLRNVIADEVKNLSAIIDNAHDVSMINVNGSDVLVTGGFSWGDAPTDSFDCISNCNLISWWMKRGNNGKGN